MKRFLGFESEKIFGSLRRIKVDREKSISSDAAAFFRQRGILNDWEYNFVQNTFRKRNLTEKQRSRAGRSTTRLLQQFGAVEFHELASA